MEMDQAGDQVSPLPPMEGLMWTPPSIKDHQMTKLRETINAKYQEIFKLMKNFIDGLVTITICFGLKSGIFVRSLAPHSPIKLVLIHKYLLIKFQLNGFLM